MGDPCQVEKVVAGMRPFTKRFSELRQNTRELGMILKRNGATASLSHMMNSIADFIDTQHSEVARQAIRDREFVFEKVKTTAKQIRQIADVWMQNFVAETRHMTESERIKMRHDLFLFSLAETDIVPVTLQARVPRTVASFMSARNMFKEFGLEQVERGMMVKKTAPAQVTPETYGEGGGEPAEFVPAGDVLQRFKDEAMRVFEAHDGKYFPQPWNFDTEPTQNNGPIKSAKLGTKAQQDSLRARKSKVMSDADAAKYTKEERIKQNIFGVTEAEKRGLETDLVKVFLAKAPEQLQLLTVDRFAQQVNVNWAREFETEKQANEAGFKKIKRITDFSNDLTSGTNKQSPPNVKALAKPDVYVHADIADDMNEMLTQMEGWQEINRGVMNTFKTVKTIYSGPAYYIRNFASQAIFGSWSKHFSLAAPSNKDGTRRQIFGIFGDGRRSYKAAMAGDPKEKAMLDLAIKFGAFQPGQDRSGFVGQSEYEALTQTTLDKMAEANNYTGHIKVFGDAIQAAIQAPRKIVEGVKGKDVDAGPVEQKLEKGAKKTTELAKDVHNWLANFSNLSDQLYRYGAFKHFVENLKMTPGQAADEVDKTFVNFNALPRWVKKTNRYSAFFSFNAGALKVVTGRTADALRAIDKRAKGEISNSEAYDQALPVLKMVSIMGVLGMWSEAMLIAQGYDEQERKLWRNSTPSLDFELMGMPFSAGVHVPGVGELNATYTFPFPFSEVFFGHNIGEPLPYSGALDSIAGKFGAMLETVVGSNPLTSIIGESMAFEDFFTGKEHAPGESILTSAEKGRAIALRISEKFTPYLIINALNYIQNREVENVSRTAPQKSFGAFASSLLGFPLADWDITEAKARADIQLNIRLNTIDELIRKQSYAIQRNKVSRAAGIRAIEKLLNKRRLLIESRKKVRPETLAKEKQERSGT